MPRSIKSSPSQIIATTLTHEKFRPFGTVIEASSPQRSNAVPANQGTALKIPSISPMTNIYDSAPSKKPAEAMTSMFVCSPRDLRHPTSDAKSALFDVKILERHPYTTQTFIPLGLGPGDETETCYLVIVCPSLPSLQSSSEAGNSLDNWSEEFNAQSEASTAIDKAPDLVNIQAFVAHGNQAVTYGAGTWHAPMIVLGKDAVEFVVTQFANGVGEEDCEEVVLLPADEGAEGIAVLVDVSLVRGQYMRPKI